MQFSPTQQHFLIWSLVAAITALALWLLGAVMLPFVVAGVLAYALNPLVRGLERLGRGYVPRVLAVLVIEVLFVLVVSALLTLVAPILAHELPRMREQLPLLLEHAQQMLTPWLQAWGVQATLDWAGLKTLLMDGLNLSFEDGFRQALASLRIGGSLALALIGNLVLIPVVLFYLLLDWRRFVRHVENLVPLPLRPAYDSFMNECDAVLGQYLRGQLSVMAMLAIYYSVGLSSFGLDLALPIGVFTGLAIFVPYLGFGVGLTLATLAGLLQFAPGYALLMIAVTYGVGQVVESFILTPRWVGERIGLHPLQVIFALLAFGQLFGFVGVLVALPVSAVLLVAVRRARARYQASPFYRGG